MKQTNPEKLQAAKEMLEELRVKRGGTVIGFHKKIANDLPLLSTFNHMYDSCNKDMEHIPRKYRELIIMALGCAEKAQTTIDVHAKLALQHGATIEEIGETLRLVFFLCGATSLIPAAEIFDELDSE